MTTMRVSQKGWVVIPAHLRKRYAIQPGDEVAIVDYGGVLGIVPLPEDPVGAARGMLKGEPSLTDVLLEERAKERARERQTNALRPR